MENHSRHPTSRDWYNSFVAGQYRKSVRDVDRLAERIAALYREQLVCGAGCSACDRFPIRIGISACLLGRKVRFDGGHKEDRFIMQTLGEHFEWVPICPEVEIGLGIPRETIRLELIDGGIHLRAPKSNLDYTGRMSSYARRRMAELKKEMLSGYILKKDSPSCGMLRVRVYRGDNRVARSGTGLFAGALLEYFPNLPVEEEGRLADLKLRENWIERVFAYHSIRSLWSTPWTIRDLIAFHTRYKLTLLAHSPSAYSSLARMIGSSDGKERNELRLRYEREFMSGLSRIATPGCHANVLLHMAGYFKKHLDQVEGKELLDAIEDYRKGLVPRIVPVTLIRHHARRLDVKYLLEQTYLNPHPKELLLRYHV